MGEGFIRGMTMDSFLAGLEGPPPGHPNRQLISKVPLYMRLKQVKTDSSPPNDEGKNP